MIFASLEGKNMPTVCLGNAHSKKCPVVNKSHNTWLITKNENILTTDYTNSPALRAAASGTDF
jgi:hypothetical protein